MTTGADMAAAALDYLRRGWSVIPLRHAAKRPLLRWQEFQYRCADAGQIARWFEDWPDANLGIVTGLVSGLLVVDVDPAHGGDDSVAALAASHGSLPATVEAATGGGGRHLYFRHPGGVIHNRAGLWPGVDLRGDGGYVVAPPSLHPNGTRYRWRSGRAPAAIALAALPVWLLEPAGDAAQRPGHALGHSLAYWRDLLRAGVPEGERNSTIASLAGHLLWHGVDAEVACELLLCWNRARCRPPLDDDEVVRTVQSITRLHAEQ